MDNSLLLNQIDAEKKILDGKRPFSHPTFENIRKNRLIEWTHHSNAVEGNTLTLSETGVVLEGITVGGKTMKEHLDVINYREAIHYIEEIIKNKETLSTNQIKKIHSIVLKGMIHENIGVYRKENAVIRGIDRVPPDYLQVPRQMSDLINWYLKEDQNLHPVERVAILYSQFIKIYPFADGNGRTARLLLNLELMKNGYVPIVIKKENKSEYYNGIDLSHRTGEHSLFIGFIAQILKDTLHFYNQEII